VTVAQSGYVKITYVFVGGEKLRVRFPDGAMARWSPEDEVACIVKCSKTDVAPEGSGEMFTHRCQIDCLFEQM
jgi:hypothetical protein